MKLVALTRVKIDGDIIEEFVRHTLQYVDELFVVDNLSPDDTREILFALQDEGLPLRVFEDEHVEVLAELTTGYTREAFALTGADYVLLLDADEFLRVPSRAALEAALEALPAGAHGTVPWQTYVPLKDDDEGRGRNGKRQAGEDRSVLRRFPYRLVRENPQHFKVIVSRAFASVAGATITPGSHDVTLPDGTPAQKEQLRGVELAHFPVRSLPQIQTKALLGWSAFVAAGLEFETVIARQWRRLYEGLRANPHETERELHRSASMYFGGEPRAKVVYDPLTPVGLRFSPRPRSVLKIAIEFIHQLTRAYAQLARENKQLKAELEAHAHRRSVAANGKAAVPRRLGAEPVPSSAPRHAVGE
jgi:hypothetical protein